MSHDFSYEPSSSRNTQPMFIASRIAEILIISAAVYAVLRRVDVRLVLIPAGLALGIVAGQPRQIVWTFFTTFADEKFVIPICSAMGFAYVLKETTCDQHLVQLLAKPLRRARLFLIPGVVLVGYIVNIPVVSQTGTAVAIGAVLIPLMFAARLSPATAGASLLLGSSIGGELLNTGGTAYAALNSPAFEGTKAYPIAAPLSLIQMAVATIVFWVLSTRYEHSAREGIVPAAETEEPVFRVNLFKAAVPMLPVALLFVLAEPFALVPIPHDWLVSPTDNQKLFGTRLIGAAMIVGVVVAACTTLFSSELRKVFLGTARAFFNGAGYGFKEIIAIIVASNCFAQGVKVSGLSSALDLVIAGAPGLLLPIAGSLTAALAFISGSGLGATSGLFSLFVEPAREHGFDLARIAAVTALGAEAGRTMSPVSAVTLMCAALTGMEPFALVKRVAPPILCGLGAALAWAAISS